MEIWILATIPSQPTFIGEAYMKDFLCKNFVKLSSREYLTENALETVSCLLNLKNAKLKCHVYLTLLKSHMFNETVSNSFLLEIH